MAQQSDEARTCHGAVLVKGGNIINAAHNKWSYSSFGKRFRERDKGISTLHAELAAVLNLDRSITQGTDIYVVRVDKEGNFKMIRLPYFGKFSVNPKRVKHINKLKDESK